MAGAINNSPDEHLLRFSQALCQATLPVFSLLSPAALGGRCYSDPHFTDACTQHREGLSPLS